MSATLRRLLPVALLMLAATVALAAFVAHQESDSRHDRTRIWERGALVSVERTVKMAELHEQQLAETVGMLDGKVTSARWPELSRMLLSDPATHGVGWVVALDAGERAAFERRTGIRLYDEPRPGSISPAPAATHYAVVAAAVSIDKDRPPALGLNLDANPVRANLLARAAATDRAVATPPMASLNNSAWKGTVIYDPVYDGHDQLLGWITSSYTAATLAGFVHRETGGVSIRVADGRDVLVPGRGPGAGMSEMLPVDGRVWRVTAWTDAYRASLMPWLILLLGLLITGAVLMALRVALGRERIARGEAEQFGQAARERGEQLEGVRAQVQALLENVPAAFSLRDLEGRYVMVNDMTVEWTGVPREELIGTGHVDYPEWGETLNVAVHDVDQRLAIEREPTLQEFVFPRADGHDIDVRSVHFPVPGADGHPRYIGSLSLDVSKEKAAERELADREELLAQVFDGAPTGQAILGLDGRWIRVNRALLQMSGYSEEELFARTFQDISFPDDVDLDMGLARQVLAGERDGYQVEKRYVHREGFVLLTHLSVSLVRNADGSPRYFVAQLQDITARRALQRTIADSEARMRALLENSPAAIIVRDLKGHYQYVNARAAEALGSTPEQLIGRSNMEGLQDELAQVIRLEDEELIAHGDPIDFRVPTVHADGSTHIYDWTKYAIRDGNGEIVALGSFAIDITERLTALAQLEARDDELSSSREHAATILASMGEGYCLTVQGRVVAVNAALCEMTGFREDQLLGSVSASPFWSEAERARVAELRDGLISVGGGSFITTMLRQGGGSFEAQVTTHAARIPGSPVDGFVSTIRDITRERAHEREQEALGTVARLVAEKAAPADVFAEIASTMMELFGCEGASLARFHPNAGELEFVRAPHVDGYDFAGVRMSLEGESASAEVFRTGRVSHIRQARSDDPFQVAMARYEVTDAVAAPIHVAGQIWGTVGLSFAAQAVPVDIEERLGRFAELAGLAIANTEAWDALSQRAATDPLTGLANHGTFHSQLQSEVARARRYGRHLSLVLLDLDHFKSVNDTYGHQTGDVVLTRIAAMLSEVVREGEIVARIGGEEFAWLMPETDRDGAYQAAERLRRMIERTRFAAAGRLTLSAGVCSSEYGRDAEQLMRYADRALYWAKDSGRNTTFLYTPEAHNLLTRETTGQQRLHTMSSVRALARAIDSKDPSTRQHSDRVAGLVEQIALQLGWDSDRAQQLYACGLLHDVGKIGIPDEILLKPGRLTAEEYETVKRHAEMSALIASEVLESEQVAWIRSHHERWDGRGYPDRLAGRDIPDGGQILAVADAFDVMTQTRSYKQPRTTEDARGELERERGLQFAPAVVDAMLAVIDRTAVSA